MNLQEIQTEIDRLKAEETALYDRIDEVQATIRSLEDKKAVKEFWIRKNSEKMTYEPAPVRLEEVTPEQAKAIMLFNADNRFTIKE